VDKAEIVKDQIIRELITFFIWLFKILPKARPWRISAIQDSAEGTPLADFEE
jgi:hypothetical protein